MAGKSLGLGLGFRIRVRDGKKVSHPVSRMDRWHFLPRLVRVMVGLGLRLGFCEKAFSQRVHV